MLHFLLLLQHFQKDIVKGIDGLVATGAKYSEIGAKLGDDCRKYAVEGPAPNSTLARAALHYSNGRVNVEKERESFHRALATTVSWPTTSTPWFDLVICVEQGLVRSLQCCCFSACSSSLFVSKAIEKLHLSKRISRIYCAAEFVSSLELVRCEACFEFDLSIDLCRLGIL